MGRNVLENQEAHLELLHVMSLHVLSLQHESRCALSQQWRTNCLDQHNQVDAWQSPYTMVCGQCTCSNNGSPGWVWNLSSSWEPRNPWSRTSVCNVAEQQKLSASAGDPVFLLFKIFINFWEDSFASLRSRKEGWIKTEANSPLLAFW